MTDFRALAQENHWTLDPVPWCPEGFFIDRPAAEIETTPLGSLKEHKNGLFYVQEASSMFPPQVVDYTPGEIILDASAAPGSKLTQISALAPDSLIIGNEPKTKRLIATTTNLDRLEISNVVLTQYDVSYFGRITPNTFDKVFLDAPCSNIHSLSDLDKVSQRKVGYSAGIQKRLIKEAFQAVASGGQLIYSTCTVTEEENELTVRELLNTFPEAELTPIKIPNLKDLNSTILPGTIRMKEEDYGTDIFYIALIKKTAYTPVTFHSKKIFNFKKFVSQKDKEFYNLKYSGHNWQIKKSLINPHLATIEKLTPKYIGKIVN